MFSFRRKSKKEQDSVRNSPSLPELSSQGIPWPENLVDVKEIRDLPQPTTQSATKPSFQGSIRSAIPFHKPFRNASGGRVAAKTAGAPISAMYMTSPPSAFDNRANGTGRQYSQRRSRVPPTFNLMVIGGQKTGKTSLLRLLLETAEISPSATVDQRAVVDRFLRGGKRPTSGIETACIEICESRFDRILLSVIDTPGLEFQEGRELKLERQVNNIIKYVDAQYADTMNEESKVIRKNKGDQHIHLCIYMIDPGSIMTEADRQALSSLPSKSRLKSRLADCSPPDLVPDTSSHEDSEDESERPLTMSPMDLKVIRRLWTRLNILPVVAHSDTLTDDKLRKIKQAVRDGLVEAGLDFGVFEGLESSPPVNTSVETPKKRMAQFSNANDDVSKGANATSDDNEEDNNGRQSRPVIRVRPKYGRNMSHSRSRRDLSQAADDDHRPQSPDPTDENVANVRFSAHVLAKTDLTSLMPFALIAPEPNRRRQRSLYSDNTFPTTPVPASEDGHGSSSVDGHGVQSTSTPRASAFLNERPEDLKGVFVRKFRWGTIDVLDPSHCDFAALRTAVLSTHFKVLKRQTKEVLYEKYRTEKLLARRATCQITDDERQRLLEDLGI